MRLRVLYLLGVLAMAFACKVPLPLQVQQRNAQWYPIDSTLGRDTRLVELLAPYKRGVDTQMQVVVGRTDGPMTKAQPESTMGNFVADAQLTAARQLDPRVDAAVANYGGLRLPLIASGPVTRELVYELMPFDNTLCIVEMPGDVVQVYCNAMARRRGWPVSGLQFVIRDTTARDIVINGSPLDPHRVYKLALNDYNARGGDGCDFLVPLKKRYTTVFVRDAIMQYLAAFEARGEAYHPKLDNRVHHAD